jgi:ethanolamine utilization protein EutQ (cupin superfamily)
MLRKKNNTKVVCNNKDFLVREYFVKKDIENLGFAIAILNGEYGENRNNEVDQVIYVINGKISVKMDGQNYVLEKEDALLIKRGMWYFVEGKAKFAVVTSPAWFLKQYETPEAPKEVLD